MTEPHNRPDPAQSPVAPADIGGRAGFALAAYALVVLLVLLLDRVGVPAKIVGLLAPCLALAGLVLVGLSARTMLVSRFYTGGRIVAPINMAMALSALVLAMALPLLPPAAGQPSLATLAAGLAGGLCLAGLVTGPMLRKSGAYSMPGLLAGRFPGAALLLACMAIAATLAFLLALAGLGLATDMLVMATGGSRHAAAAILCVLLILMVVPGGLGGVTWLANGAFGLALGAVCVPLALRLMAHETLPLPGIGDAAAMMAALGRMAGWPSAVAPLAVSPLVAGALAIGLACLPALASGFATLPQARDARRAALVALPATGLVLAGAMALIALAVNGLDRDMIGRQPDALPAHAYALSARGLMPVCGQNVANPAQARAACVQLPGHGGLIRVQDLAPGTIALLLGMTEAPHPLTSVILAALAGLGLALAASGMQALATIVAHEGLFQARRSHAMTSRRLAIARMVLMVASASAAALVATQALDQRWLAGGAVLAALALLAPLLLLVVWPKATTRDAQLALLASAVTLVGGAGFLPTDADNAALTALAAAGIATATGLIASLLHRKNEAGTAFFHALMRPGAQVLPPDPAA